MSPIPNKCIIVSNCLSETNEKLKWKKGKTTNSIKNHETWSIGKISLSSFRGKKVE